MTAARTVTMCTFLQRIYGKFTPINLFHSFQVPYSAKRQALKGIKKLAKHEEQYQVQKSMIVNFLEKRSLDGVEHLKEDVIKQGGSVNNFTFDAQFLNICSGVGEFELGKDFFQRLYSEGRAGVGAIGKFFSLCYTHADRCGPEEHDLMLKVYDELLDKYGVLDVSTCEQVAQGIGLTRRWRSEIPRLLEMVTHSDVTPSPSLWSTAVESSFRHGEQTLGWKYLDSYVASGKFIFPNVYEVVLKYTANLLPLLKWLESNGVIITTESAEIIAKFAPSVNATAHLTRVSRRGFCNACRNLLKPTILTQEQFDRLRSAFLDPVLVGRDVFQKTRPEEIESYLTFLDKVLPVDVVLDGLNIAYASKRLSSKGSLLLRMVTSHFVSQSQKILVVGRQHMKGWPAADMNYVRSHASVFLADNLSQDDPFLLFAALKSGMGTKFVSRDRMSGHRHLLGETDLQATFSKWQSLHQCHPLHIAEDGVVTLRHPTPFARAPQLTSRNLWHLPVVDHSQSNVDGHLQDETAPWLCVSINSGETRTRKRV